MAISHNARYCNGFPNFLSNTDVLEPSFNSMLILSILSIPVLSGHKSGHTFSGLIPCLEGLIRLRTPYFVFRKGKWTGWL